MISEIILDENQFKSFGRSLLDTGFTTKRQGDVRPAVIEASSPPPTTCGLSWDRFSWDDNGTKRTKMPHPKDSGNVKTWMTAIALIAVVLYCGMLIVRSYLWMVRAGW